METKCDGSVFPRGKAIESPNFIGKAWLEALSASEVFNCPIYHVSFAPGARNSWHRHPGGQILLVTEGRGWYQERGKPEREIRAGDVVEIQPEVEHWHGAAADSALAHLAISANPKAGEAVWLEPVADDWYGRLGK